MIRIKNILKSAGMIRMNISENAGKIRMSISEIAED